MKAKDFETGDRVVYIPDAPGADAEIGTVSSVRSGMVFVKYDCRAAWPMPSDGDYTAAATPPENLRKIGGMMKWQRGAAQ